MKLITDHKFQLSTLKSQISHLRSQRSGQIAARKEGNYSQIVCLQTIKREKMSRFTVSDHSKKNHCFFTQTKRENQRTQYVQTRRRIDCYWAIFNPATLHGKVTGKKTKMRERKTLPFDLECNSQLSKNATPGFSPARIYNSYRIWKLSQMNKMNE